MWRQIESLSMPESQFQDYHVRRTSALSVAALTFLQFDNAPNGRTRSIRQYVSFTHPVVRRGILLHALSIFQAPIFLFTPAQIVFLVVRCRAMVSGDPAAVNTMLGIIHFMWCHDLVKLTPAQIRGQFEKDYWVMIGETGGVVGVGPTDFKLPTKREMEEEGKFQRQRLATAEDDNDDPFGLPTRQEIEGQLAYQDGTPSMSMLESCLAVVLLPNPPNHPIHPKTKPSAGDRSKLRKGVTAIGLTGLTVQKLLNASSTSSVYGGQRVAESSPAFMNTRKVRQFISEQKKEARMEWNGMGRRALPPQHPGSKASKEFTAFLALGLGVDLADVPAVVSNNTLFNARLAAATSLLMSTTTTVCCSNLWHRTKKKDMSLHFYLLQQHNVRT
ncbi:hypothetical protein B0H14DRAFT_2598586 [Mycena olivaceomarginata]|nr:hypothetical protein B0H14DRAFT_2598586 [Mycena olivaceomarginata]